MLYKFVPSAFIYRGRYSAEYLIVSPYKSLHIKATNSHVVNLLEELISGGLKAAFFDAIIQDNQADALLKQLLAENIVENDISVINSNKKPDALEKSLYVVSNSTLINLPQRFLEHGFRLVNEHEAIYYVIVTIPYDPALVEKWNSLAVERKKIALFASIDMSVAEIGPLIIPGQSARYHCLIQRRRAALKNILLIRENWISTTTYFPESYISDFIESLIVMTLSRFAAGSTLNVLLNEQLCIDLKTCEIHNAPVRRYPRCEICAIADPAINLVR